MTISMLGRGGIILGIGLLALSGLTSASARAGDRSGAEITRRRPVRHDPVRVWLWKNAIRLDSVDGFGPPTDLLPLSPWVAGADIIALGDGTHGTREYYTVKRRLLQFFAEAGIARTLVFEGPWPEFLKVNDYVQGGDADPREALLEMTSYPFWRAEEILELAEWAREFNASRAPDERIEILGADVYLDNPRAAADLVVEFLQEVDPVAAEAAVESYACVPESIKTSAQCGVSIMAVRVVVEQNAEAYQAASSLRSYQRALHSARVLEQLNGWFQAAPADKDAVRDTGLAANVAWFSEEWTGSERLLVWMHSAHIGKLPALGDWKSMGQHLVEKYGSRYFAIGTCMLNGTLRVYFGTSSVVSIQAPLPTNYELLFARASWDAMVVPLFHPDTPEWLVGPGNMRIATGGYDPTKALPYHNASFSLPDKYDAVIYIRETSPIATLDDVP
jgi:erythromycin esterase